MITFSWLAVALAKEAVVWITADVRRYAAEKGISESQAIESGMQEKRNAFNETGAELYANA